MAKKKIVPIQYLCQLYFGEPKKHALICIVWYFHEKTIEMATFEKTLFLFANLKTLQQLANFNTINQMLLFTFPNLKVRFYLLL